MQGEPSSASVSSDLMQILFRGLFTADARLHRLLTRAGIDPAVLERSQHRIPAKQFDALWTAIEAATDDPNLGLHLGELRGGLPVGHVLFAAMMNSPTVGTALERYCRYHAIMADIVQPRISPRGGVTVLGIEPVEPKIHLHRQHVECVTSLVVSVIRHLAEGRFHGEVRFRHRCPDDVSEHRRLLGPSVLFGQSDNEISLEGSLLQTPIARADAELLGILEQHAASVMSRIQPAQPWTTRVSREVGRSLCDGKPSLADVAKRLATSQRSLQNRLKEEGTTYQEVLDTLRTQLGTSYLLRTQMTLSEIAFLLGFRDQSSFSHSFRRWTGQTPRKVRGGGRRPS